MISRPIITEVGATDNDSPHPRLCSVVCPDKGPRTATNSLSIIAGYCFIQVSHPHCLNIPCRLHLAHPYVVVQTN